MKKDFGKYVWDNGYYLLGTKKNILKMTLEAMIKTSDEEEYFQGIIEELKEYKDSDIILVDYENPMGYRIEVFQDDSKTEVE